MMNILYTADAISQGGRNGTVRTSDGRLDLKVTMPKEMQGPGGEGTNPEQLFAAGYAACFHSALKLVAGKKKIEADDSEVTAHVSIGKDDGGGFQLAVRLDVKVPGVDSAQAKELAEEAHQVCPYSKATRGNIQVELNAVS